MTIRQYIRVQTLMLKDEICRLTQDEHDEMFALLELLETDEGGEYD